MSCVNSHVNKQLVACIERPVSSGTAMPKTTEVFFSPLNMRAVNVTDQTTLSKPTSVEFKKVNWNRGLGVGVKSIQS